MNSSNILNVEKSWLSDHPLISVTDNGIQGNPLKLGVFNVLAKVMSQSGDNSNIITPEDNILYKKFIDSCYAVMNGTSLDQRIEITIPNLKVNQNHEMTDPQLNSIADFILDSELFKTFAYDKDFFNDREELIRLLTSGGKNGSESKKWADIHKVIIDTILRTSTMGGFEYGSKPTTPLDGDMYNEQKPEFLTAQITQFFSDTKHAILVCPEFDEWFTEEALNTLTDSINVKYKKCGYYLDPKRKQGGMGDNLCKIVLYKGLDPVAEEATEILPMYYPDKENKKQKYTLDYLKFEMTDAANTKINIFALHGDSTVPNMDHDTLELKKVLETAQILKHINEKIEALKDSHSHSYLLGDFNHPFHYNGAVMKPYLQLCQGGGAEITPELFTPIEKEGERLILKALLDNNTGLNGVLKRLLPQTIYNQISSYKNNFKIHYHQDMTTESFGAMEKHRPYSLINAQIEKGAENSRTYGTDFIGKIIIKSHESDYVTPYEKFTLHPIAPEFIERGYMFPFFNYEKTSSLANRRAVFEHTGGFSGGNRSRKRKRYRKRNSRKRVSRKLRKSRKPRRNNRKRISRKTRKH